MESVYFDTDLNYLQSTYNLFRVQGVDVLREKNSKGRFIFTLGEADFVGVKVQITSKSKLNIYYPVGAPKEYIVERVLSVLSEANCRPVKIIREKEVGCKQMSPIHMANVASGLLCLLSDPDAWHNVGKELKPNFEYERFALQHLEAYPEIYEKLPYLEGVFYFSNTAEAKRKFKAIRLQFMIEEMKKRLCMELTEVFRETNLEVSTESFESIVNYLLSLRPPFQDLIWILDEVQVEKNCLWAVEWKSHLLYSMNSQEEAENARSKIKGALAVFLEKEESLLEKTLKMIDHLDRIGREFRYGVRLLVLGLSEGTVDLKGKCDVCCQT